MGYRHDRGGKEGEQGSTELEEASADPPQSVPDAPVQLLTDTAHGAAKAGHGGF